jgi:hypothetical protein
MISVIRFSTADLHYYRDDLMLVNECIFLGFFVTKWKLIGHFMHYVFKG